MSFSQASGRGPRSNSGPDLNLSQLLPVLRRRRNLFWKCFFVCCLLTLIYLAVAKRRYRADAELQVLSEDSAASVTGAATDDAGSALQLNLTMQTYAGVLTSDTLALNVIRELQLEQTPEYHVKLSGSEAAREAYEPLEKTRVRREEVLRRFRRNLQVSIVSGSRLITASFLSTDPDLASKTLNQLLNDFVEYNYDLRLKASLKTEDWLGRQLVDLKARADNAQAEAARLQVQTGSFGIDGTHNIVVSRLESLDQELISAQQNRIVKEAILHVVNAGDPEAISNLSGTAGQSMAPGSVNSLALIQTLRQQESVLSTQYADLTSKYGSNYPRVIEVREQLAALTASIQRENDRLTARAKNDYKAALEQERNLQKQMDQQKGEAAKANDLSVRYLIASREAASSRDLYEHLLQKLKEAGIFSGLHSTNIDVIDPPHVGAAPSQPKWLQTLAIGMASGLLLGLAAIFLVDSLDPALYEASDAVDLTGAALLGTLPLVASVRRKDAARSSQDALESILANPAFTEALRQVRTAIQRKGAGSAPRRILVTSSSTPEGKSTVAAGLAGVLAQQGHQVLLIDADLRHGQLSRDFGLAGQKGLSDLIANDVPWTQGRQSLHKRHQVDFLPSGSTAALPSELLSSANAARLWHSVSDDYDYVLLDSVSVLAVADAVELASQVDGVILVVRPGLTSKQALVETTQTLAEAEVVTIGCVLNGVRAPSRYAFSRPGTAAQVI